jgi:hypothetical protein
MRNATKSAAPVASSELEGLKNGQTSARFPDNPSQRGDGSTRLTFSEARRIAKANAATIDRDYDSGDIILKRRGLDRECWYFASDISDALGTLEHMLRTEAFHVHEALPNPGGPRVIGPRLGIEWTFDRAKAVCAANAGTVCAIVEAGEITALYEFMPRVCGPLGEVM